MKDKKAKIIIIGLLSMIGLWMFFSEDATFSASENRSLQDFPKISWSEIRSGAWMKNFETYLTDQFPMRDDCLEIKTRALSLMGERLINGVYLAEKGYLIAEEVANEDQLSANIKAMEGFAKKVNNLDVNLMLVPNSVSVYEDLLPYSMESNQQNTLTNIQESLDQGIDYIDVYKALSKNTETQLYYRTDHHWTTRGAYIGFLEYMKAQGTDCSKDSVEFLKVSDNFYGTQASAAGVYRNSDSIEICVPVKSKGSYLVSYVDQGVKTTTLFEQEYLTQKDQYEIFQGGNFSQIRIETTAGTGKNLLIIKDSFANSMLSMLTPYYSTITVIDPRYYYENIYELIQSNQINEVLFLYNLNTFTEDNSLIGILNMGKK